MIKISKNIGRSAMYKFIWFIDSLIRDTYKYIFNLNLAFVIGYLDPSNSFIDRMY